ncbi:hypothetical protein ACFPRL_02595 [Pseudoclavibacter helvolus]
MRRDAAGRGAPRSPPGRRCTAVDKKQTVDRSGMRCVLSDGRLSGESFCSVSGTTNDAHSEHRKGAARPAFANLAAPALPDKGQELLRPSGGRGVPARSPSW